MRRFPIKARLAYKMMESSERWHVPHSAMCEITWRCNLNCVHCYLPQGQRRQSAREAAELSTEDWFRAFDQMAELGVLYLTISGGEVCLRRDFLDLVAHARALQFDLRIFTTGTLFNPKIAQALVDHHVGKVEISVYGNQETHDKVVRIPGSFARSIAAGRILKAGGVTVIIKCPLMNLNIQDYPYLVDLADKEGFFYKFDPTVVPQDDRNTAPLALRSFDDQLKAAFRDPRLRLATQGDHPDDHQAASPLCEAGRTYLAIGPQGDVYPCIEWRTVLGNVKTQSLSDIWGSTMAKEIRNYKREDFAVCNGCALLPFCPRCTGLAEREDGNAFGPSKEACHLAKLNYEVITGKTAPQTGLEVMNRMPIETRPSPDEKVKSGCGESCGCGSKSA